MCHRNLCSVTNVAGAGVSNPCVDRKNSSINLGIGFKNRQHDRFAQDFVKVENVLRSKNDA